MADTQKQSPDDSPRDEKESPFFWWLKLFARCSFAFGCAGTLILLLIYHWPEANVPVYYIVVRPSFVWFGAVLPFLLVGILGVRLRWFAPVIVLWCIGLGATGDYLPLFRYAPGSSRVDFATARMAYREGNDGPANSGAARVPLRIITWNIAGGRRMRVEDEFGRLARLSPDIVLLQECSSGLVREARRKAAVFEEYESAGGRQAILSRFPVSQLSTGELGRWRVRAWKVRVSPESRVVVITVHLASQPLRTQFLRGWSFSQLRKAIGTYQKELHGVRAMVEKYSRRWPVILAGDFNLPPCYPPLRRLRRRLKDCFSARGYGWGKTVPASFPVVRIDMIMVPRSSRVYYAAALPTDGSDHRPVIAEATVPARSRAEAGLPVGRGRNARKGVLMGKPGRWARGEPIGGIALNERRTN